MRKKITILFDGPHLSYSPTTIGLYDLLSKQFDVTVVAENPDVFEQVLTERNVVYKKKFNQKLAQIKRRSSVFKRLARAKQKSFVFKTLARAKQPLFAAGKNSVKFVRSFFTASDEQTALLRKMGFDFDVIEDFLFIRKHLADAAPDFVIAVDFKYLLFAQILGRRVEFLSLEIAPNDFYRHCDFQNINSVVIQTPERYEHLFKDRQFKTFFVQNAPVYAEFSEKTPPRRKGLVYCGTAWDAFGFYHCLDFLREYPEYTLNVKGAIFPIDRTKIETEYADLIANGQLAIDDEYLGEGELLNYLRQFKAGFCFYNFEIERINNFNYRSAPSGKMFKYMAAGVPVVGQRILGLKPVEEFDCGVLINDLKPASIKKAVDEIEANFEYNSRNALKAAAHYSFDKTAKPFVDYLAAK